HCIQPTHASWAVNPQKKQRPPTNTQDHSHTIRLLLSFQSYRRSQPARPPTSACTLILSFASKPTEFRSPTIIWPSCANVLVLAAVPPSPTQLCHLDIKTDPRFQIL